VYNTILYIQRYECSANATENIRNALALAQTALAQTACSPSHFSLLGSLLSSKVCGCSSESSIAWKDKGELSVLSWLWVEESAGMPPSARWKGMLASRGGREGAGEMEAEVVRKNMT
jgi:hypothetical protein